MARYWIDTTRAELAAYSSASSLYRGADIAYPYVASTDPSQRILVQARFCDFGASCLSGANAETDKAILEAAGFTTLTEAETKALAAEWFPVAAPSITTQPAGGGYVSGTTQSVSVVAANATAYQWSFSTDDETYADIEGATSASYEFMVSEETAGYYKAVVSNVFGLVASDAARIEIDDNTLLLVQVVDGGIVERTGNATLTTTGTVIVDSTTTHDGYGSIRNTASGSTTATGYTIITKSKSVNLSDFCIEGWVNPLVLTDRIASNVSGSTGLFINVDSSGYVSINNYNLGSITSSTSITSGLFFHLAYCRNGSDIRMFINGTERASGTSSGDFYVGGIKLGYSKSPCCWENFRVSNVARYTSNFTPPARF